MVPSAITGWAARSHCRSRRSNPEDEDKPILNSRMLQITFAADVGAPPGAADDPAAGVPGGDSEVVGPADGFPAGVPGGNGEVGDPTDGP